MSEPEDIRSEIKKQIADLSKLLGMIPGDDTIAVSEPGTHDSIALSILFSDARNSFLKLSTLIGKALDLDLQ